MNQRETFAQIAHFFEELHPQSVAQLKNFYSPTAHFKDPFNQVQGIEAIEQIFLHMYESLENPRFVITAQVVDGQQAFMTWDFKFRFVVFQPGPCLVNQTAP